ncbi:hypothetical protein C9374_005110 [Naegleria lovaniensis]|uniref:Kinesin motor domain-containing protein n=1 Tax=Naegleria lovaniensis TaxID=51637 RepID=A0AA88GR32_NAELO|nr:uncharacterized protein C9374_005110 [Naegleria lovaniensis]KAG2382530.1 hypothetical protein C9374_005110 [Naegleria lovaniensis]
MSLNVFHESSLSKDPENVQQHGQDDQSKALTIFNESGGSQEEGLSSDEFMTVSSSPEQPRDEPFDGLALEHGDDEIFREDFQSMLSFASPIPMMAVDDKDSSLHFPKTFLSNSPHENHHSEFFIQKSEDPLTGYETPVNRECNNNLSDCSAILHAFSANSQWSDVPLSELPGFKTPLKFITPPVKKFIILPDSAPRNVISTLVLSKDFSSTTKRKSLKVKKMNISGNALRFTPNCEDNHYCQSAQNDQTSSTAIIVPNEDQHDKSSGIFSSLKELQYYGENKSTEEDSSVCCHLCRCKDAEIHSLKEQLEDQISKYNLLLKEYDLLKELYEKTESTSDTSSVNSLTSSQSSDSARKVLRNVISFDNVKFIKLYCRVRNFTCEELEEISKIVSVDTNCCNHLSQLVRHTTGDECNSESSFSPQTEQSLPVLTTDDSKVVIRKYLNNTMSGVGSKMSKYEFHFDKVFGYNSDNSQVTESLSTFINRVIDDEPQQRLTIMAYGATGSGKTFTIQAIMNYVKPMIFSKLQSKIVQSIHFNCFEVYNEQIVLLMNTEADQFKLVQNENELEKLIQSSHNKRKCAETEFNKRSSRSHCIYRFKVCFDENDQDYCNILNIVDLAGSERLSSDEFLQTQLNTSQNNTPRSRDVNKEEALKGLKKIRNTETVNINKSLSVLSQVIKSLAQGSKFINYRDSTLTKILKHDLSQVALVVNLKPPTKIKDKTEVERIVNSLTFAKKANAFEISNFK